MIHAPSIYTVKSRTLSAQKTKTMTSDLNVPELTPFGMERKREQDEFNRVAEQQNVVDLNVALAKKNAKRATALLNEEINETTAWLEECEVKIGELKSKLAKEEADAIEKDKCEQELKRLQVQRKKKMFMKQLSIDEKLLLEQKLKTLLEVPVPKTDDTTRDSESSARSTSHISGSNASTADVDNEDEQIFDQVLIRKGTAISIQKDLKPLHNLNCNCSNCVSSLAREIRQARAAIETSRNTTH